MHENKLVIDKLTIDDDHFAHEQRVPLECVFIASAGLFAKRSTCLRKQVGCVIVIDGRIVSTGYSGSLPGEPHCINTGCEIGLDGGCVRTVHAEANAILFAGRYNVSLIGSTLYTTLSPCKACSELIILAGIRTVIYRELYRIDCTEFLVKKGVLCR